LDVHDRSASTTLERDELVAALRRDPARTGLLFDFDGTLSPIVDDPAAARPLEGVTEVLERLAASYAVVAVVSGRPVDFLVDQLPRQVVLSGLYGLEVVRDGRRADAAAAGAWREAVADVAHASAARGPSGMLVEPKGLSLTLHYRTRPDLEAEVLAWADSQAARSGLQVRRARMSVELHPPVAVDKGTAVDELVESLSAACFVGDDVGDLPAFDALDRFASRGGTALRVVVDSPELDPALQQRADLVVDGPAGVLALLRDLTTD
jgi:trehalose 6-phosphate phosphatase